MAKRKSVNQPPHQPIKRPPVTTGGKPPTKPLPPSTPHQPIKIPAPPTGLPAPPKHPEQPIPGSGPLPPFVPTPRLLTPSTSATSSLPIPYPPADPNSCNAQYGAGNWYYRLDPGGCLSCRDNATDPPGGGVVPFGCAPGTYWVLNMILGDPQYPNGVNCWTWEQIQAAVQHFGSCTPGEPGGPSPPVDPCSGDPTCGGSQPMPPVTPPPQCDSCLDNALQAIAQSLQQLADSMGKKCDFTCSQLDGCLDYLVDKLKDKILPPATTCDQCCKRIEIGLATAVECAAVSANCTCQSCVDQCSSETEGSCCTLPDGTSGTCQSDICTPNQPQPPGEYWIAWCNPDTGESDATSSEVPVQHDPPWQDIGHYPDFMTAAQAAQANCTSTQPPSPQPPPVSVPPVSGGGDLLQAACNITAYANRESADSLLNQMAPPVYADTLIGESVKAARQLGDEIGEVPIVGQLLAPLVNTAVSPAVMSGIASDILCGAAGCNAEPIKHGIQTLIAIGIGESLVNIQLPQLKLPVEYAINASTRNRLIEPGQALTSYLANGVSEQVFQASYAAAGFCEGVADADLQAARAKPNPIELRMLLNRDIIKQPEYDSRMRQLGYLDQSVIDHLYTMGDVRPSLAEVLHMMIRDADNDKVKEDFDFDVRFEDKFGKTLERWCKDQQIPVDVVKMAYRSHWDIPSKQELFEFVRRLRNDPKYWSAKGWESDINAALTHNNVLPHWFDSYKAILYHPLGRIDIRRSYQIGALNDDEVKNALQQLGYSDDNVNILFRFLVKLKNQQALKHESITEWVKGEIVADDVAARMREDGFTDEQITTALDAASIKFAGSDAAKAFIRGDLDREAFESYLQSVGLSGENISAVMDQLAFLVRDRATEKEYVAGLINKQDAENRMIDNGVAPSVAANVLLNLDDAMEVDRANRCRAAIRKQFLTGGLTAKESVDKLVSVGIVSTAADNFVDAWSCEKSSRDKHAPATTVCGWLAKGAITSDDFVDRMVNIGFTRDDALLLLGDCSDRIQTQQAKKQAKEAADKEKAKRQEQAAADRAERRGRQALASLEKARAEKVRLRKQRQTQFLQIAKNVEKKSLATPQQVVDAVISQSNRLETAGFTLDEALRILLQASEALASSTELPVWFDLVSKFSEVVAVTESEDISPEEPNISS